MENSGKTRKRPEPVLRTPRQSSRWWPARSQGPGYDFELTYHTVQEVDAFEDYLRDTGKYVIRTRPVSPLNPKPDSEDREWMLNEQMLVMCDAAYALTRYGFVTDEEEA
jgi:hypothetical protein